MTLAGPAQIEEAIADLGVEEVRAPELARTLLAYIGQSPGELRLTADVARSAEGQLALSWLELNWMDGRTPVDDL